MGEINKISVFEDFEVHNKDEHYSFVHLQITNKIEFLKQICKFILSEDNLLKYVENNTALSFKPTSKNYAKLYRKLHTFIDDENLELDIDDENLKSIIKEETSLVEEEGRKIKIRLSKIGRIGEYIAHLVLSQYFNFTCIIPKVSLTTNKNMSVYGIDELFLCMKQRIILFGESKVTKELANGISLINKSLIDYEQQIRNEFLLIFNNNMIEKNGLKDIFSDKHEVCISFDEFIKVADIQCIGVPLFIAHGNEIDKDEIISKLENGIDKKSLFGLDTKYYVISLPIIDKDEFFECLTLEIKRKMEEYDESR